MCPDGAVVLGKAARFRATAEIVDSPVVTEASMLA